MTDETYSGIPKIGLQLRFHGAPPMNHGIALNFDDGSLPSRIEVMDTMEKLKAWALERLAETADQRQLAENADD